MSLKQTYLTMREIYRGNGDDNRIVAWKGDEFLDGKGGNDTLYGKGGNDKLSGGHGNDKLVGGTGKDLLIGGKGADAFVFDSALGPKNVDTIRDFSKAEGDKIMLHTKVFGGLMPFDLDPHPGSMIGGLNPNAFRIGKSAKEATDRIVYDPTTGALSFDKDGNGAAAAVKFAQLKPGTALNFLDFMLFA